MVPATHDRSLDESLFFSTSRINVAPKLSRSSPFAYVEEIVIKILGRINEALSYNVLLNSMKQAFEHCRILLIPTLSIPLPFRQALMNNEISVN